MVQKTRKRVLTVILLIIVVIAVAACVVRVQHLEIDWHTFLDKPIPRPDQEIKP